MTLRVLVVARGYPSHDAPGRGSSVADHVALLRGAGAEVTVASFETVQIRGDTSSRGARLADVESAWARAVASVAATDAPRHWGAADVPVARLPVVRTWGAVDGSEADEHAARHAGVLAAFGRALASRAADEGRPLTLIHAHTGLPDGLAAVPLAAELRLPLVVTEHDSTIPRRLEDPHAAAAYRRLLASATVVAVSQALADRIQSALDGGVAGGTPPVGVLSNVVPMDLFPAWSDEPRDDDELLWVGARAPHKGIETMLSAVAVARERRPALHLRMIGPSTRDDEARWVAMTRDLGIGDAVLFEPAATREAVGAAMRRTGLFVHPSPWETFGMVAAEALASGAPVAATPSGGVEGIVGHDGRLGEIATDDGPGALADAIVRLRDRLPELDRRSFRDDIGARFGTEATTARTLDLYREAGAALDDPAPRPASPGSSAPDAHPEAIGSALVVAVHPSSADRVKALPDGPVAVRVVGPPSQPAAPASGGIQRVAVGLRRRLGPAGPTPAEQRHATTLAAIRAGWDDLSTPGSGSGRTIVAADADDVSAVIEALGDPGRDHLAPGSLRWLADRQDAPADAVGG